MYVSNEDVKTASVINIASGKVEHIIPVGQEPEGVHTTPDGKSFYVTCETGGDVFVVDTTTYTSSRISRCQRGRAVSISSRQRRRLHSVGVERPAECHRYGQSQVIKTIVLPDGSRPMSVQVAADGKVIYVSDGRRGTMSVIDAQTYEVLATIKVGERPWGIALPPTASTSYAPTDRPTMSRWSISQTNKEITRVKAGASPWGIAVLAAR